MFFVNSDKKTMKEGKFAKNLIHSVPTFPFISLENKRVWARSALKGIKITGVVYLFHANVPFLHPLKTSKNIGFLLFSGGIEMRSVLLQFYLKL